ncbi:MAG: DUF3500 domain-containing protein [Woeseiaceae bacterium]
MNFKNVILLLASVVLPIAASAQNDAIPENAASATQMSAAATAFVAMLDEEQLGIGVFDLEDEARPTWSNLPISMVRPSGMLIGDMNDRQRAALHDLLRASMSSQGYAKITGIMRLDDLLFDIESAQIEAMPEGERKERRSRFVSTRSSGNYAVGVYGDPASDNWGWKVAGHHGAANFTVSDGRVGFTPTFVGSSPMTVDSGRYAGWSVLSHEGSRGVELMASLSEGQQEAAMLAGETPADIIEGPGNRASLEKFEGLKTDELSVGQMRLLQALVSEYVRNADFDAAEAQLELINAAGWEELWFSWSGPVDTNGEFYYRVHGPRILIEYNRQNPNHDHAIIRDPQNDYGEDWLAHHYEEYHDTI